MDIYKQARHDGWSRQQMNSLWSKAGISDYDLGRFERHYQSEVAWRNMSLVAVGVLGAPVLATSAPGLFTVSADLALTKMTLSFGIQSFFNGIENVDYFDVAADGFTAPGLNATLNGAVDIKPFSRDHNQRFRIAGINKPFSQFGVDAGTAFVGGSLGHATWEPLTPFLNNYLGRSIFYFSTQSWISSATQQATNTLNK